MGIFLVLLAPAGIIIYTPCRKHELQKQNTLARLCDPASMNFKLNECCGGRSSPRNSKGIDARGWLWRIKWCFVPGNTAAPRQDGNKLMIL